MNMFKVVALLGTALAPGLLTAEPVITKHAVAQAFNELGNATDEYPKLPKNLFSVLHFDAEVKSVAYSPDGKHLVAGDTAGSIKVWDDANGELLRSVSAHSEHVNALAYHPNGQVIASGSSSSDGSIKIWDGRNFKLLSTIDNNSNEDFFEDNVGIVKLQFNDEGNRLFAAVEEDSGLNHVIIYNSETGEPLSQFGTAEEEIEYFIFSSDGKRLAIRTRDQILLWNTSDKQPLEIFSELQGTPDVMEFDSSGRYLVAKSYTAGCIAAWDVSSNKAVSPSSDITELARKSGVSCYSTDVQNTLQVISEEHEYFSNAVSFHPDGTKIAFSSYDDFVQVWDTNTRQEIDRYSFFSTYIYSQAHHPVDNILAVGQTDGLLTFWDTEQNKLVDAWNIDFQYDGRNNAIKHLSYSPDGKVLSIVSFGGSILLWDVNEKRVMYSANASYDAIAFNHLSKQIAYSTSSCGDSENRCIVIKDYESGSTIQQLDTGPSDHEIYFLTYNPDGKMLIGSRINQVIQVWDTDTWRKIKNVETGQDDYLDSYAHGSFSPDGKYLAAYKHGHSIHVRKVDDASWAQLEDIDGFILSFSPDSKELVVSDTAFVEFWDTTTWSLTRRIDFNDGMEPEHLSYSPDGKTLVVGGYGVVKMIDLNSGELKVNLVPGPEGHWLKYTEDGKFWHSGSKRMIASELFKQ